MPVTLRSQRLAAQAIQDVTRAHGTNYEKHYAAACLKFPYLVLTNGLMQTVAFLGTKAKGDKPRNQANQLFLEQIGVLVSGQPRNYDAIAGWVAGLPRASYAHATQVAMEAAVWYKRFAISVLGADPAQRGDE